ncbi:MAG: Holliday junction resolvase RuvX [Clostridia bacterium]|nr:Holliday junction resolvase RuvX [Clostridia bacterium]
MKILGIDYGDRFIGFAECDDMEIIAYPLTTVKVKSMKEAVSGV